jgi:hypothetical protein
MFHFAKYRCSVNILLVWVMNSWNHCLSYTKCKMVQGPSSGEQASSTTSSVASDVKAGGGATESTSAGVSTDKNRNYAVLAGTVVALGGLGWYLLSKPKKSEEVVDWKVVNGIFWLLDSHGPLSFVVEINVWGTLCSLLCSCFIAELPSMCLRHSVVFYPFMWNEVMKLWR